MIWTCDEDWVKIWYIELKAEDRLEDQEGHSKPTVEYRLLIAYPKYLMNSNHFISCPNRFNI